MKDLKPGQVVTFQCVDRVVDKSVVPPQTNYALKSYVGTVVGVRDTTQDKVKHETVKSHPDVERSRYLVTVKMPDNKIRNFYSGKIVNLKTRRKNFFSRLLGV